MSRRRDERGAVAIMVAVMAVILFVVAALVVDLGLARDTKQRSQVAADASALAAANALYPASGMCTTPASATAPCLADAAAAAKSYAAVNFGTSASQWTTCADTAKLAVPDSTTACISFDSATSPTLVRVLVPREDVDTGFGVLAGVDSIPVSTSARASVSGGPARSCGLCVLGSVSTNNTDFSVSPGAILVNGSIGAQSNSNWTAGQILVGGSPVSAKASFNPNWQQTIPISDPYASLAMPATTGTSHTQPCATTPKKGSPTPGEGPGVYGTLTISDDCEVQPGVYVITGKWTLGNKGVLRGTGVTLVVTSTGELDFKNGDAVFSAPTTGATKGFAIIYDRGNTKELGLQGNGKTDITGAIYAKSATINFNGNSCMTVRNGPIVIKDIDAVGNKSCIQVMNSTDAQLAAIPGDIALDE